MKRFAYFFIFSVTISSSLLSGGVSVLAAEYDSWPGLYSGWQDSLSGIGDSSTAGFTDSSVMAGSSNDDSSIQNYGTGGSSNRNNSKVIIGDAETIVFGGAYLNNPTEGSGAINFTVDTGNLKIENATSSSSGGSSSGGSSGGSSSGGGSSGGTSSGGSGSSGGLVKGVPILPNTGNPDSEKITENIDQTIIKEEKAENDFTIKDDVQKEKVYENLYGLNKEVAESISRKESGDVFGNKERVSFSGGNKTVYDNLIKKYPKASQSTRLSVAYFIEFGTPTTKRLGSGERAGVINSFGAAFAKSPDSEEEWQDVIKIANGRWPSEKSVTAENKALVKFKKVYRRSPKMTQANDNAAVTIMAYGLRPVIRNTESEKAAIKSFKYIYGKNPSTAEEWDVVRAIAYSGAKR